MESRIGFQAVDTNKSIFLEKTLHVMQPNLASDIYAENLMPFG
jgi:hypothetical protein